MQQKYIIYCLKMQKLFFELLQVALGRLDCVDRAPLEEEWPELYRMAREHGVAGTCYQGVEKLFEFGLRGPQDLMLDWMAESEETFDADVIELYTPIPMKNPFKNNSWKALRNENKRIASSPSMHLCSLLIHAHELLIYRQLKLRILLDAYRLLRQLDAHYEDFANGEPMEHQLSDLGFLKFTRGIMWVLGETMKLERRYMPCEPLESEGRFILEQMMNERRQPWALFKHYPFDMLCAFR